MITFPNAKINLGLSITEKRPDGYHNLETVFYPVALEDALEIRTSPEADKKFSLHQYGMEISGNPEDNLVVKAYLLLDKEFHLCPIEIHLYKHIPSGAGLGGGSSDAAFMLKLQPRNRILPRRSRRCAGNPDQPRSGQKVLPASVRNGDIR